MDMETLRALNLKNAVDDGIESLKNDDIEEKEIEFSKSEFGAVKTVMCKDAVADFLIEKYHIITYGEIPYIYQNGYYRRGDILLNKEITEISKRSKATTSIRKEALDIMHFITSQTTEEQFPFNVLPEAINVLNGVIVFDRKKGDFDICKHSHEFKFNYILNVSYKPDAPDTIYKECYCKWTDEPDVLLQISAQAIIQSFNDAPFKQAYIIQADPHAGKSTFLTGLDVMFKGYISGVPLQDLSQRFNIAPLENMMFNICDELADIPMSETGTFKKVTGGYVHSIERKGREHYSGRINAVHVYTCNVPPMTDKRSILDSAFWERWYYIVFNNYFPVNDKFVDIYTPDNLSGIFNRILDMVCRIFTLGVLPYRQSMTEVRERWSLATDVIHQYIEENIDTGCNNTMYVDREDLLNVITKWAVTTGKDIKKIPKSVNALTDALTKHGIEAKKKRHEYGNDVSYVILGDWVRDSKYKANTYKMETRQIKISVN